MISLVGFMASGKSTLGPLLALVLDRPFRDLDRLVEEEAGETVARLFATGGEVEFRRHEGRAFRRLQGTFSGVLATGGGFPCSEEALSALRAGGPVLFLDPPWPVLRERLAASAGRPLAEALSPDQLESLYRARLPWYQRAGRRVELPAGEDPARQLDRLLRALEELGGSAA
jgi:shikimate kinase